jgi:hypothetical protein
MTVSPDIVSLGEPMTPIVRGEWVGVDAVWKVEGGLPADPQAAARRLVIMRLGDDELAGSSDALAGKGWTAPVWAGAHGGVLHPSRTSRPRVQLPSRRLGGDRMRPDDLPLGSSRRPVLSHLRHLAGVSAAHDTVAHAIEAARSSGAKFAYDSNPGCACGRFRGHGP